MLVALASGCLGRSCSTRAASLSGLRYPPFVPTPAPVLSDWSFPSLLPGTTGWPADETSLWGIWAVLTSVLDGQKCGPAVLPHAPWTQFPTQPSPRQSFDESVFNSWVVCVPVLAEDFHRTSNLCAFIFLLCHKESSLLLLCSLVACLSNFLFPNEA